MVLFEESTAVQPQALVKLMQRSPREYRLEGAMKLRIARVLPDEEARFDFAAASRKAKKKKIEEQEAPMPVATALRRVGQTSGGAAPRAAFLRTGRLQART